MATVTAACDRGYRGPEDGLGFDGGLDMRDAGSRDAGRSAGRGAAGSAGRSGGFAGSGSAGRPAPLAGAGGTGVAGGAGVAGAPDPGSKIDCTVDNGGCGDPEYWECITGMYGSYCADRDECSTGSSPCDPLSYCINVRGGDPDCGPCPGGYEGSGKDGCTDIDECENGSAFCGDPTYVRCVNQPGYYACEEIMQCETDNGGCGDPARYFCVEQGQAAPLCRENECFVDNGGCGSPDQMRCVDRADVTAICVGKVVQLAPWAPLCALRSDGTAECLSNRLLGGRYRLSGRYEKIVAGPTSLCGIETAGSIRCESAGSSVLQTPPTGTNFTDLGGAYNHACALRSDGSIACWGMDNEGTVSGPAPETNLRHIAAGPSITCVVRNAGTIACFGPESDAMLGANEDGGADFIAIYVGFDNVCALHMNGSAECWGNDEYGQLSGIAAASSTTFQSLSIGSGTICGLRSDATVRCWGNDAAGQASGPNGAGGGVTQVAAGATDTCLLFGDGTFRCFGSSATFLNMDVWARPDEP